MTKLRTDLLDLFLDSLALLFKTDDRGFQDGLVQGGHAHDYTLTAGNVYAACDVRQSHRNKTRSNEEIASPRTEMPRYARTSQCYPGSFQYRSDASA